MQKKKLRQTFRIFAQFPDEFNPAVETWCLRVHLRWAGVLNLYTSVHYTHHFYNIEMARREIDRKTRRMMIFVSLLVCCIMYINIILSASYKHMHRPLTEGLIDMDTSVQERSPAACCLSCSRNWSTGFNEEHDCSDIPLHLDLIYPHHEI